MREVAHCSAEREVGLGPVTLGDDRGAVQQRAGNALPGDGKMACDSAEREAAMTDGNVADDGWSWTA
jgi:hypothetical protein